MDMKSDPDRIDEEQVCIDSLCHHLNQLGHRKVSYERESHDPPDFWVTISGQRFAAEVTSIVSDHGYTGLIKYLKTKIYDKSSSEGDNIGTYALIFDDRPEIPKRGSNELKEIVNKAIEFIAATQHTPQNVEQLILKDSNGQLSIRKWSDSGPFAIGTIGPILLKWEDEAETELAHLIQGAIKKKMKRLQNVKVQERCAGIILLFYDAYGFCDVANAYRVLRRSDGFEWFHSTFWAASFTDRPNHLNPDTPGRLGFFLHSKNVQWSKNNTINLLCGQHSLRKQSYVEKTGSALEKGIFKDLS